MVALLCFFLTLLASPFKSNSRLEAENAALRHELTVLQRKIRRRVQFTNSDRVLFNRAALILNRIRKGSRETHGKRPRI
jgi:hypothetical protein